MRIIGKRVSGETAVYEVMGLRYYVDENGNASINCMVSDASTLVITGDGFNISHELSQKYCKKIFETGYLDLLEEPVQMDKVVYNIGVSINNTSYNIGVPMYLAGISDQYLSVGGRFAVVM